MAKKTGKKLSEDNLKLIIAILLLIMIPLTYWALKYLNTTNPATKAAPAVVTTGNGAPNGAHYQFNMIGVPKGKSADMTNNDGRRMFVPLEGTVKINLAEGDFRVLDANGTDGTAAFSLPNPDVNCDGTTDYSVFVRALGKPGGKAFMSSCYTDTTGEWCAANFTDGVSDIQISRDKGKSTFTNVSKDLLYVDYCQTWDVTTNTCTKVVQVPLFGDKTLNYFWNYDNSGLKNAQLRFYQGYETQTGWQPVCSAL